MKKKDMIRIFLLKAIVMFLMYLSISFKSIAQESSKSVKDIDGNEYKTVKIGTQTWMAENLKVTHYQNGDPIPNVTGSKNWEGLSSGAYCWYSDNHNYYGVTYGALYNFYAVKTFKLCPVGWHVPSNAEWTLLKSYLGDSIAGIKLKEIGDSHWIRQKAGVTNESGFTALPGGQRKWDGAFILQGIYGYWWAISENGLSKMWFMKNDGDFAINLSFTVNMNFGLSVRCIKD